MDDPRVFVTKSAVVAATNDFVGTELRLDPHARNVYELRSIEWQGGGEAIDFTIAKISAEGHTYELFVSPAQEETAVTFAEEGVFLAPGDRIAVITDGATAEMSAKATFEQVGVAGVSR